MSETEPQTHSLFFPYLLQAGECHSVPRVVDFQTRCGWNSAEPDQRARSERTFEGVYPIEERLFVQLSGAQLEDIFQKYVTSDTPETFMYSTLISCLFIFRSLPPDMVDDCSLNNGNCSDFCSFDYSNMLDFYCHCPEGKRIDETQYKCELIRKY